MNEPITKEKLLHCPFCGYEAEIHEDDDKRWKQAVCGGCGAKAPEQMTFGAAVAAWNRRVSR